MGRRTRSRTASGARRSSGIPWRTPRHPRGCAAVPGYTARAAAGSCAPPAVGGGHAHVPGFQVDVGLQQQRQGCRLGPQVAFDLEAQGVGVHLAGRGLGAYLQGMGEDARLVGGDGLVDDAFERVEVDVRRAVAGQCRQPVVDYRGAGRGVQRGAGVEQRRGVEQPGQVAQYRGLELLQAEHALVGGFLWVARVIVGQAIQQRRLQAVAGGDFGYHWNIPVNIFWSSKPVSHEALGAGVEASSRPAWRRVWLHMGHQHDWRAIELLDPGLAGAVRAQAAGPLHVQRQALFAAIEHTLAGILAQRHGLPAQVGLVQQFGVGASAQGQQQGAGQGSAGHVSSQNQTCFDW
ncbi:hypothetical protein WR25_01166 [Diploscapter pachys]|uniref:Uncharacterized protein n=1 Tax=Diploscapter pachys TaxID=2018661 RepID=A0A2A2JXZ2_9BILA|nr:hypothetical protein WR25_01166 [Diploscapter pachys]